MKARTAVGAGLSLVAIGFFIAPSVAAQVTQAVSISTRGVLGHEQSGNVSTGNQFSADDRYIVFQSSASNLVPNDTNDANDVFIRDRFAGTTELISTNAAGGPGNGDSGFFGLSISADGRFVAFESTANNLVPGGTNYGQGVFVRDRLFGTTEIVSVSSTGQQGNGLSGYFGASISADGRYVAFPSYASNLVPGDTNGQSDVFVHDRRTHATTRVSVDSLGNQGSGFSTDASISNDGRCVVFITDSRLVSDDSNGKYDVYVHDRETHLTERVSISSLGVQGNDDCKDCAISGDGRFVAFMTFANNMVPGHPVVGGIFVRDRLMGTMELVSVNSSRTIFAGGCYNPKISADGRYVTFATNAALVPNDTNGNPDVYVHDLWTGMTERVSISSAGLQTWGGAYRSAISADGRLVSFESVSIDLVHGNDPQFTQVLVHDRHSLSFQSVCDPGLDGVIPCPCSNPPSESGNGCDNSSGTGGAHLSVAGVSYLSTDSVVFSTLNEIQSATSVLIQNSSPEPNGVVFGQGIVCGAGTSARLYTKSAVNSSITAPQFSIGDLSVSTRSAELGVPIAGGQSRWYFVYYRDPSVLGACPRTNTFNTTQTVRIDWSL